MPVRPMSREQSWLLPPSLDELLPDDHPSRFVAAFVEGLDRAHWAEMGIDLGGDGSAILPPQTVVVCLALRIHERNTLQS